MRLTILLLSSCFVASVTSTCSPAAKVCEFHLVLTSELTMTYNSTLVKVVNRAVYTQSTTTYNNSTTLSLDEVITGDGWSEPRRVVVFNDQMPGPTLNAYKGQTVIVHVTNRLGSDTTSVHWHGVDQITTPWMDGESYITQCPILPGQTFSYRFLVLRAGTYWYHSDVAGQMLDGAFGPLVVRERSAPARREFTMTVQDWNHSWDSDEMKLHSQTGWFLNGKQLPAHTSPVGSKYTMTRAHAGLVNGRGRYRSGSTTSNAPLTTFTVDQGYEYRFRTINTGAMFPFRISVDQHALHIVAVDGVDVKIITVESFIIFPGERVDFIIYADNNVGNYWVRGESVTNSSHIYAEAVLRYRGASDGYPTTSRTACSSSEACLILNCPFPSYPGKSSTRCIPIDKLKSLRNNPVPTNRRRFQEVFLNFAIPGHGDQPGSVNGHAFNKYPISSVLSQHASIPCNRSECGDDKVCHCPLVLDLQQGKQLQIVFINMGQGRGWDHPVHIHGHHVSVLKTGYAKYDSSLQFQGDNLDVDCTGNPNREQNFCNTATWGNPTWLFGNVPDINTLNPPQKDTIVVPNGGYVVVRLRADNPGLWMVTGDTLPHLMEGMSMLVNESYASVGSVPTGFPSCQGYTPGNTNAIPIPTTRRPHTIIG